MVARYALCAAYFDISGLHHRKFGPLRQLQQPTLFFIQLYFYGVTYCLLRFVNKDLRNLQEQILLREFFRNRHRNALAIQGRKQL